MPKRGSNAAGDTSEPSRSAIVGGTAAGHHLLDIDGYSRTKGLPTGKCIKSRIFKAGGSSWRIWYYPNGDQSDSAECISVFLELFDSVAEPVKAQVKFSLLDQSGEAVPSHSQTTQIQDICERTREFGFRKFIKKAWLEQSQHLADDHFTIRCDVLVCNELRIEKRAVAPTPVFVQVPPSDMNLHLGELLVTKKGADVTFQVGSEKFRAHRCVLAARSTVFEVELFGPMKEGKQKAVIRVDDMEAEVFRALLGFVYTDALPECPGLTKQEEAAMAQHLLVAADRYNLKRMKLICEEKLCKHIDTGSVVTILLLADQHYCHGLKKACFQFLSSPLSLNATMATDGFEHLTRSYPSVFKELMFNIAARLPDDLEEA